MPMVSGPRDIPSPHRGEGLGEGDSYIHLVTLTFILPLEGEGTGIFKDQMVRFLDCNRGERSIRPSNHLGQAPGRCSGQVLNTAIRIFSESR